jgi:hypothetical protein
MLPDVRGKLIPPTRQLKEFRPQPRIANLISLAATSLSVLTGVRDQRNDIDGSRVHRSGGAIAGKRPEVGAALDTRGANGFVATGLGVGEVKRGAIQGAAFCRLVGRLRNIRVAARNCAQTDPANQSLARVDIW